MEQTADDASLSREAWIDAAFAVLIEKGVEAVRVQPLARSLNVTRGSFYWHFRDLNDLLRSLLDRWFDQETRAVIEAIEAEGGEASTRLLRLLEACARDEGGVELAMRNWARSDARARDALRQVDETRTGYLKALLIEMGHAEEPAQIEASIAYLVWLGLYSSYAVSGREARIAQMRQVHTFLVAEMKGAHR